LKKKMETPSLYDSIIVGCYQWSSLWLLCTTWQDSQHENVRSVATHSLLLSRSVRFKFPVTCHEDVLSALFPLLCLSATLSVLTPKYVITK